MSGKSSWRWRVSNLKPFLHFNRICHKTSNMKKFLSILLLSALLINCKQNSRPIVSTVFVDSITQQYSSSPFLKLNEDEIFFWKSRIDSTNPGYTNEQKYAGNIAVRFQLKGAIKDLQNAYNIMLELNETAKGTEANMLRTLARISILQHKFKEADGYVRQAISLGSEKYASLLLQYDVAFELGAYNLAANTLKQVRSTNEYGYFFRKARQFHFLGEHDSSIVAMKKSLELASNNLNLQQATLSNIGDLYLHAADVENAYKAYQQSLVLDPSDIHSLMGLGWIALIHDKNNALAEKIFRFADETLLSPDPLIKRSYTATQMGDSIAAKKFAADFAAEASDSSYGIMYNKYLIDFYTGILNEPAKAKALAERELMTRKTPQTYSWLAYALYKNNEPAAANAIYKEQVSGKSLEGLELYYMGMMMEGMNKSYNAKQFFEAAYENRYDLSPDKITYLKAALD